MDRIIAAQAILDGAGSGTYLEIGVNTGGSFIPIRARRKWGVDPGYRLTRKRRLMYSVLSLLGIKEERLFRMTSDEFFRTHERMLAAHGLQVCLVDGQHTYEQALKDALNALRYLEPKGVILMHDCNPPSELMALPAADWEEVRERKIPGWNGEWSGDVWKALVHLRSLRDDVSAFTLDCDSGLGVVVKEQGRKRLEFSQAQIRDMDYQFLSGRRAELLDLRPAEEFSEFLRRHMER